MASIFLPQLARTFAPSLIRLGQSALTRVTPTIARFASSIARSGIDRLSSFLGPSISNFAQDIGSSLAESGLEKTVQRGVQSLFAPGKRKADGSIEGFRDRFKRIKTTGGMGVNTTGDKFQSNVGTVNEFEGFEDDEDLDGIIL